jgi:hypothetical protein
VLGAGFLLITHLGRGQAVGAAGFVAVLALGHSLRHVVVKTFVFNAFNELVLQTIDTLGLRTVSAKPGHVFCFLRVFFFVFFFLVRETVYAADPWAVRTFLNELFFGFLLLLLDRLLWD